MPPLKSMKTDLDHLPEKKRRELQRIQEILFEEFALAKGTSKTAKGTPERILKLVLFGSYARGDWVDEAGKTARGYQSDFDLLIVVNRKACKLTRQHRSTQRKKMVSNPLTELRQRMHQIVATRIRYGYRRVHIMLKREGWQIGRNRVYRVYREEGLALKTKRPRRRKMATHREARCQPKAPNEAWSLDFVYDQLSNGQKIRALTVIDVFTRECLAIEVGHRLRGDNVVEVLNRLVRFRGAPKALFADNGAKFTGQMVDLWAYHNKVRMDFSRPATPTDDAHIESFNGSLRDESLNVHRFETLTEAQEQVECWRRDYNESRPHMALGNIPPAEFALQTRNSCATMEKSAV